MITESKHRVARTVFDHLEDWPSEEQVYEHVKAHLLASPCQAQNDKNGCLYLTAGGLKCAVGCLLDDEQAASVWDKSKESAIDGIIALSDTKEIPIHPPDWMKAMARLLKDLQEIHDNASHWDSRGFIARDKLQDIGAAVYKS